jgi:hypothetical protein
LASYFPIDIILNPCELDAVLAALKCGRIFLTDGLEDAAAW